MYGRCGDEGIAREVRERRRRQDEELKEEERIERQRKEIAIANSSRRNSRSDYQPADEGTRTKFACIQVRSQGAITKIYRR